MHGNNAANIRQFQQMAESPVGGRFLPWIQRRKGQINGTAPERLCVPFEVLPYSGSSWDLLPPSATS